jgi:hypothetical protein
MVAAMIMHARGSSLVVKYGWVVAFEIVFFFFRGEEGSWDVTKTGDLRLRLEI